MNRIYVTLIALLLITQAARAQQNSITGTWQLDLAQTVALMESNTRQTFDNLDPDVKSRMETSMSNRIFSFSSNGNVTVNWQANGAQRISSGTWQVSEGTLSITIENDVQSYTFELTAGSHLVLRNTTPSGFFSNLYFTWHP